jgi:hypothetical protein
LAKFVTAVTTGVPLLQSVPSATTGATATPFGSHCSAILAFDPGNTTQVAGRARRTSGKDVVLKVKPPKMPARTNLSAKIADDFDPIHSGDRKFYAREFFLDQDRQLELIERVKTKIVSEVRFVCNSFGIDT